LDGHTDTQVILFPVQCYALHWTDNENAFRTVKFHAVEIGMVDFQNPALRDVFPKNLTNTNTRSKMLGTLDVYF